MGCSVGLKYAKNALAAGAPPRTPLGELTTLPRLPNRLEPLPIPNPLGAFGASFLAPSALRSSCPPWKPGAPAALELAIRSCSVQSE